MPASAPPVRHGRDHCPTPLRLFAAADGWLARVHLPGGLVGGDALRGLAALADDLGQGALELTSRGNVQLRGLAETDGDELVDRLTALGLVRAADREHARNVLASPLAGVDGGTDLTGLVRELDDLLCAHSRVPGLSGRFLFAIDDGRGDVATNADVVAVVRGARAWVEGLDVAVTDAPAAMLGAALAFLDERRDRRSEAWRVADIDGGRAALRRRLGAPVDADPPVSAPAAALPPIGPVPRADGGTALVALPPLGRLTTAQAGWLADHASGDELRITPWRAVVIPHAPSDSSNDVGLVVDPASPWRSVTACAGRPGCRKALADVRADAAAALTDHPGVRVHWAGCERCCGRTAEVELTMVATPAGYRVEDRVA